MDTNTQNKIAEYYAKLPPNVQNIFSSMVWMEELQKISDIYKLNDAQKEVLGTETTLVFLGMVHFEEYENILIDELVLPKETVDKMIVEINEAIFKPIKMDLIKTYKTNAETLADETYGGGKKLDERFAKLPQDVQEAISSLNYEQAIVAIGQQFNLTVVQMGVFEATTTKVMLGVVHPREYRSVLASQINLPKEKIDDIVTAVNTKVFLEIRESFMKMFENDLEDPRERARSTENIRGKIVETSSTPTPPIPGIGENKDETEHADLDREDLLSQIENPVPLGGTPATITPVDDVNNHVPEPVKIPVVNEEHDYSLQNKEGVLPEPKTSSLTPTTSDLKSSITSLPKTIEAMKQGIPDFLKNKLAVSTTSEPTTTNHSLPKITSAPPANLPVIEPIDPYHEAIN